MHSSSGRVSLGIQKNDRWNSRFLTGYRFRSIAAAGRYRAPWTTGWSAGRQSRREFAVQRSVQHIEWAFCFCHVHSLFRFLSASIAARFYWWEKHMFLMFCITILHIYCFVRKQRKSAENLRFLHFESTNIWLALRELRCATSCFETVLLRKALNYGVFNSRK